MDGFAVRTTSAAGFSAKPRTTAKARHKDDQERVSAHALSVGRTGKVREPDLAASAEFEAMARQREAQVPVVPRRENSPEECREHLRRDIGSRVMVYELGAADNPADLSAPFADPQGAPMHWAARCATHGETRYFAEHRRALQAAKA